MPGSLGGSWTGPHVDPMRGNQTYEIMSAEPAGGWTLAAVASVAAACLIVWLLVRPAAVPRPRAASRATAACLDILLVSVAAGIAERGLHAVVRDAGVSYPLALAGRGGRLLDPVRGAVVRPCDRRQALLRAWP